MSQKYFRSIQIRRNSELDDMNFTWNPTLLYDYQRYLGHHGVRPFHGIYDEERYHQVRETVKQLQIDGDTWPYYEIEPDFYRYNKLGYRTHEFHELPDQFDLVIGAEDVEGVGLRAEETWVHLYEQQTGRTLVNLGKAGCSNIMMKWNLQAWMMSKAVPSRILIFWTEPSRESYHQTQGLISTLCYGNQRCDDVMVNTRYQQHLQDARNWSNHFLDIYTNTNLMLTPRTQVYNFFSNLYWKESDVHNIMDITQIPATFLSWNNQHNGWAKFQNYNYFPAADMTHHGWQHHKAILKNILEVIYSRF